MRSRLLEAVIARLMRPRSLAFMLVIALLMIMVVWRDYAAMRRRDLSGGREI